MHNFPDADIVQFTAEITAEVFAAYTGDGPWAKFFADCPPTPADVHGAVAGLLRRMKLSGASDVWEDYDIDEHRMAVRDILLTWLGLPHDETWQEQAEVNARLNQR